jgi:hypothetical protein
MQRSRRPLVRLTGSSFQALALAVGLIAVSVEPASAAPPAASGTITTAATGASNTYALTLSDGASSTTPIGSVWAAWVPGQFYFTSTPTSVSEPTGWSGVTVGDSIQWTANSPSFDVPAGGALGLWLSDCRITGPD